VVDKVAEGRVAEGRVAEGREVAVREVAVAKEVAAAVDTADETEIPFVDLLADAHPKSNPKRMKMAIRFPCSQHPGCSSCIQMVTVFFATPIRAINANAPIHSCQGR